ncbi:MAG TPA: GNAT family N-acetyltransferase, partial [bacterium (Candidatus Stahlbacteria)]|nr:GNAT family N-acetyltransferase [Candidatus Stahlbacteria bacterium]
MACTFISFQFPGLTPNSNLTSSKFRVSEDMEIKRIEKVEDFERCLEIQRRAWDFEDVDLVPVPLFVLARDYGGIVLGGYEGEELIGFVFSIPAFHNGKWIQHSHMLAVLPQYQNQGIGYRLKLAQKKTALRLGFDLITWTFDFLQAKNCYFNFSKLKGYARTYLKDYYGQSSSLLHSGLPTDRILIEWAIGKQERAPTSRFTPVLTFESGRFVSAEDRGPVGIEIPKDIQRLKEEDMDKARRW